MEKLRRLKRLKQNILIGYIIALFGHLSPGSFGGEYDIVINFQRNLLVSMQFGARIPKRAELPLKTIEEEEANHDGQSWGRVIWHADTTPEWWIEFIKERDNEIARLRTLIEEMNVLLFSMTFEQALADKQGHEWLLLCADLRHQIFGKRWALSALREQLNAASTTSQQRELIHAAIKENENSKR